MDTDVSSPVPLRSDNFATTRWSIVQAAGHRSSPDAREALAALCEAYWAPLYAYARRREPDVATAQDLTQAFFAELLEKNYVEVATRERGRFRAFLLTAFKHFLSKEWERARAHKRGGGQTIFSLDFARADSTLHLEPTDNLTPEACYERQWALTLLANILDRLQQEMHDAGKGAQFEVLKDFLIADGEPQRFAAVAVQLGVSEAAARKAASRLRQRYRELLRETILQTVSGPEEVDDELHNLFQALGLR